MYRVWLLGVYMSGPFMGLPAMKNLLHVSSLSYLADANRARDVGALIFIRSASGSSSSN